MKSERFTEPVENYTVLILHLDSYKASGRILPDGFALAGYECKPNIREREKRLLQNTFDDWDIPYCGRLPGWRQDSPIYVVQDKRLVGGVYLSDKNEFNSDPGYGQLHYAFMDPQHQGLGIYSIIFREAVERARAWHLKALYLNSDRYLLPDVYIRWGAAPWKIIEKKSRLPRNFLGTILRIAYKPLRQLKKRLRLLMNNSCS